MDEGRVLSALDRSERALERIQSSLGRRHTNSHGDDQLRNRVKEAVAELDQLIRETAH